MKKKKKINFLDVLGYIKILLKLIYLFTFNVPIDTI